MPRGRSGLLQWSEEVRCRHCLSFELVSEAVHRIISCTFANASSALLDISTGGRPPAKPVRHPRRQVVADRAVLEEQGEQAGDNLRWHGTSAALLSHRHLI